MTDPIRIDASAIQAKAQQDKLTRAEARQVSSDESFEEACEEAFNPWAADKDKKDKFRALEDRRKDVKETQRDMQRILAIDKGEDSAKKFQERNDELDAKTLVQLLRSLKKNDTLSDILKKVQDEFADVTLQDEALEYLAENAAEEFVASIVGAREEHKKRYGSRIVAGKNISKQAKAFSQMGLGTRSELRDLYRDITENPREPNNLFDELSLKYSYEELKAVINFLLHSLGSDLRSKGPSISRGELVRLFTETRTLQAILGVYRFFQSRSGLIDQLFSNYGMTAPTILDFESMSKLFMKLLQERYPSGVKIMKSAGQFSPEEDLSTIGIIISQWRDAIRNISPRLYKTPKQKEDLLQAILEALEEIEEQEEERRKKLIEDQEEEERKRRQKEKEEKKKKDEK